MLTYKSSSKNLTYGYFSEDGLEFIITTPKTPKPWINVISNGDYGLTISQTGSGYSWRTHAQLNRITRWEQDLVRDNWGKYIYIRDNIKSIFWSATFKPVCKEPEFYRCRHGLGYTVIESLNYGIKTELTIFVPVDEPLEIWKLKLINQTDEIRNLSIFSYLEWLLGVAPDWHREFHKTFIETRFDQNLNAIIARKRLWDIPSERGHWNTDWKYLAFHSVDVDTDLFDCDKESFVGMYNDLHNPSAVANNQMKKRCGNSYDAIASLNVNLTLEQNKEKEVIFTLGCADSEDEVVKLINKYKSPENVKEAFDRVKKRWNEIVSTLQIETPDESLNVISNVWLKYQAISGRLWGRSAYYQVGGAYGFRDQLQDSLVFLYIDPDKTKEQIILHAKHQFKDGKVYHWWHPIIETGLVNEISDNRLWLPFVVIKYIEETGDLSILDEKIPFVDDPEPATIYEHCIRAIELTLSKFSSRGLPLIGGGDWNDGLNAVGLDGKGESIWLAHFLYKILNDFAEISGMINDVKRRSYYMERARALKSAINEHAWDGKWYFRATKDNGEKIGSSQNEFGKIFLNAQTWAIISGTATPERAITAIESVEKYLECEIGPLLLYPAYSEPDPYIGYLTRYAPGSRENGGVYTHAATWAVIAEAILKRNESAYRILSKINPANPDKDIDRYCAEPYVTPGNVDGPESPFFGRGGWTWYTGSSAWLLRAIVDYILGIKPTLKGLYIEPCVPESWKFFRVKRIFRRATYLIEVYLNDGSERNAREVYIDDVLLIKESNQLSNSPERKNGILLPVLKPGSISKIKILL